MYAIKSNDKYLKFSFIGDSVYEVKDTDTPQVVKHKAHAQNCLNSVVTYLKETIEFRKGQLVTTDEVIVKTENKLRQVNAQIAEKEQLPYKDVATEMGKLTRKAEQLGYDISNLKQQARYTKSQIKRLEHMLNGKPKLVKLP